MANQDVKDFVEDMEFAQLSGSLSCPLVLTNCFGETLETSVDASYAIWVYPTEVDVKKEIKLADLPGTLQLTFKRYLQGSPYLMPFSESEGLLVNFQLNLELNITE